MSDIGRRALGRMMNQNESSAFHCELSSRPCYVDFWGSGEQALCVATDHPVNINCKMARAAERYYMSAIESIIFRLILFDADDAKFLCSGF